MSSPAIPVAPATGLPRVLTPEALLQFALAIAIVGLSAGLAVANITLAYGFAFLATFVVTLLLPASTPFLLIFAFLFQNTFVAMTATEVESAAAFDQMRGINIIMLGAVFLGFFLTGQFAGRLLPPKLRPWILANWVAIATVCAYVALGLALGNGRDALVYARGILTPLMLLQVGLVCGARFQTQLAPLVAVAAVLIIAYGYCELLFELDFLKIFNGDRYLWLKMQDDMPRFVRQMNETGFVVRGLDDMMRVALFNISGSESGALQIFRLSGPNFHPISFGYALALLSTWLFANRIRWVALLTAPLLVFVGAKGAAVLFVMFFLMVLGARIVPVRFAQLMLLFALGAYVAFVFLFGIKVGDYHVLGLIVGLREFPANPFGHGVGSGGVMGEAGQLVDWQRAQAIGSADVPVESAIGVMLYQLGIGSAIFLGLLIALGHRLAALYAKWRVPVQLFGFTAIATICANAFFQEEAFFSPLALGLCLLLSGLALGEATTRQD